MINHPTTLLTTFATCWRLQENVERIMITLLCNVWCILCFMPVIPHSLLTGRAKIINLVFVDSVYINLGPLVLFISFHVINSSLQINYDQQKQPEYQSRWNKLLSLTLEKK